jgi:hypothetical protein
MTNTVPEQLYGTDDYIKYDFHRTDVTPDMCESAVAFAENNPDTDEHSYNQFRDLRTLVEENFNNPYDLERITDEIGEGYEIAIGYRTSPTDEAWGLLDRYFKLNGWLKFTYSSFGCYKWHTRHKDVITDSSSGINYRIKVYHKLLEQTDALASA